MCICLFSAVLVATTAEAVAGDVYSYECTSFPVDAGWELLQEYCNPEHWLDGGWLIQHVGASCPQGPNRGQWDYGQSLAQFEGHDFFIEWVVQTDGDRSEIVGTAPAALSAWGRSGVLYHFTISRDRVRFMRFRLPTVYADIAADVAHRYRLEVYGEDRYVWYIDGRIADEGVPEGPYPRADSRINIRAKSWYLESTTKWSFIRYVRIPEDASGDYDSDDNRDLFDYYFAHECFSLSGPDADAGPGCRFADFDGDADTDLRDFAAFQNAFTGDE